MAADLPSARHWQDIEAVIQVGDIAGPPIKLDEMREKAKLPTGDS